MELVVLSPLRWLTGCVRRQKYQQMEKEAVVCYRSFFDGEMLT
jgi:hypothetical protein